MNNKISKILIFILILFFVGIFDVNADTVKCTYIGYTKDNRKAKIVFYINWDDNDLVQIDSVSFGDLCNNDFDNIYAGAFDISNFETNTCLIGADRRGNRGKLFASYGAEFDGKIQGPCKFKIGLDVESAAAANTLDLDTAFELTFQSIERISNDTTSYCVYNIPKSGNNFTSGTESYDSNIIKGTDKFAIQIDKTNKKIISNNLAKINGNPNLSFNITFDELYSNGACAKTLTFSDDEKNPAIIIKPTSSPKPKDIDLGHDIKETCDGILGKDFINFLKDIFKWIKIVVPILVIILGSVDFAGSLLQDDKDAMKKATSKFIKRLVVAVAIFLLTFILTFILNIFNKITGTGVETTICEVGMINLKK